MSEPAALVIDAQRLAAWSALALQLHRHSRQWAAAAFMPRAADGLLAVLPFDAIWWGAQTDGQDEPGTGIWQVRHEQGPWPLPAGTPAECRLLARWQEPLGGLHWVIALQRAQGQPGFDADERQALPFLLPHLVEAWRECQLNDLAAPAAARAPGPGHALCGADGRLQVADERFMTLLRLEWPHAGRLAVPPVLAAAVAEALVVGLAGSACTTWQGRRVVATLDLYGGGGERAVPDAAAPSSPARTVRLVLRLRSALDRLSDRQRDIAQRYAAGRTGPQIAAELGLSASTVNNHLGVVFKKLGVANKLQLLRLVGEQGG